MPVNSMRAFFSEEPKNNSARDQTPKDSPGSLARSSPMDISPAPHTSNTILNKISSSSSAEENASTFSKDASLHAFLRIEAARFLLAQNSGATTQGQNLLHRHLYAAATHNRLNLEDQQRPSVGVSSLGRRRIRKAHEAYVEQAESLKSLIGQGTNNNRATASSSSSSFIVEPARRSSPRERSSRRTAVSRDDRRGHNNDSSKNVVDRFAGSRQRRTDSSMGDDSVRSRSKSPPTMAFFASIEELQQEVSQIRNAMARQEVRSSFVCQLSFDHLFCKIGNVLKVAVWYKSRCNSRTFSI